MSDCRTRGSRSILETPAFGFRPVGETARASFTTSAWLKLTIHTGTLMAAFVAIRDAMRQLKETGELDLPITGHLFRELIETLGVPEMEALSKKYSS